MGRPFDIIVFGRPFDRLRDLGFYDVPTDNGNAENDIETEADVADEMRNLADIFVIVPPIGHTAKHRGDEYRKHIDEHDEVETPAVQRRHARQNERHDQNGQLNTEVFHRVFKVGSPKQAYDVHEVKGY